MYIFLLHQIKSTNVTVFQDDLLMKISIEACNNRRSKSLSYGESGACMITRLVVAGEPNEDKEY